jgi:hypothetical protein
LSPKVTDKEKKLEEKNIDYLDLLMGFVSGELGQENCFKEINLDIIILRLQQARCVQGIPE